MVRILQPWALSASALPGPHERLADHRPDLRNGQRSGDPCPQHLALALIVMSDTPPVAALVAFLQTNDLVLRVLPSTQLLRAISYRSIEVRAKGQSFVVPVFDEYADANEDNPTAWLHLVLEACEYFEEADNFATWRLDIGLKDEPVTRHIHRQLTQLVPLLREQIGTSVKAIRHYEIEFNTGIAKALRACTHADIARAP
ncbi:MAG: hypothetical protein ACI8W7_002327 [Gammaproteobacteria bacterium]|jgi:hypothetical protein